MAQWLSLELLPKARLLKLEQSLREQEKFFSSALNK